MVMQVALSMFLDLNFSKFLGPQDVPTSYDIVQPYL